MKQTLSLYLARLNLALSLILGGISLTLFLGGVVTSNFGMALFWFVPLAVSCWISAFYAPKAGI